MNNRQFVYFIVNGKIMFWGENDVMNSRMCVTRGIIIEPLWKCSLNAPSMIMKKSTIDSSGVVTVFRSQRHSEPVAWPKYMVEFQQLSAIVLGNSYRRIRELQRNHAAIVQLIMSAGDVFTASSHATNNHSNKCVHARVQTCMQLRYS